MYAGVFREPNFIFHFSHNYYPIAREDILCVIFFLFSFSFAGTGGDPDVMNTVWIYDTAVFPFHRAEEYHQFHDVNTLDAYARTRPACMSARMCLCVCVLSFFWL